MKKHHLRNKIQFCRFGSLNPITHEQNWQTSKESLGFHSPPCKKGMYAFVYPFIEKFLLSASSYSGLESSHPKLNYIKDKKGNKFAFRSKEIWEKSENCLSGTNEFNQVNLNSLIIPEQRAELSKFLNKQGGWLKDIRIEQLGDYCYLVKQITPKIFTYEGEIWHHLELYLDSRGEIIQQRGSWVKTDFQAYKKALHTALGRVQHSNYRPYKESWDFLEVFIEKI